MANRKRAIQIKFTVNEEEKKLIEQRQELSGIKNKGAFYRKMIIDGVVVHTDLAAIKELTVAINRIGTNINQVARRVNQTGQVFEDDIQIIDEKVEKIWQLLKSTLSKQR